MRERPKASTEETVERQDPRASRMRQERKRKVHSLIDKVYSRKNLEMAWQKVKENRGSAGIDEVTIVRFDQRKGYYLGLLHRKLCDGTYRPKPVKRVAVPKSIWRNKEAWHSFGHGSGGSTGTGTEDRADL